MASPVAGGKRITSLSFYRFLTSLQNEKKALVSRVEVWLADRFRLSLSFFLFFGRSSRISSSFRKMDSEDVTREKRGYTLYSTRLVTSLSPYISDDSLQRMAILPNEAFSHARHT